MKDMGNKTGFSQGDKTAAASLEFLDKRTGDMR